MAELVGVDDAEALSQLECLPAGARLRVFRTFRGRGVLAAVRPEEIPCCWIYTEYAQAVRELRVWVQSKAREPVGWFVHIHHELSFVVFEDDE
jgi:hypothetical protein